jgi:hypothetical protein
MEPGIRSLDNPPAAIAAQFSPVLMRSILMSLSRRYDGLNTFCRKLLAKVVGIVSPIQYYPIWFRARPALLTPASYGNFVKRRRKELYLGRDAEST